MENRILKSLGLSDSTTPVHQLRIDERRPILNKKAHLNSNTPGGIVAINIGKQNYSGQACSQSCRHGLMIAVASKKLRGRNGALRCQADEHSHWSGTPPSTRTFMPATIRSARHRHLAAMLRSARKEAGFQQAEVAGVLGRHQPFIANIEQAQRRVDVIEFLHLARILGFDPHQVLDELIAIGDEA